MSTACDNFLAFLNVYTPVQIQTLIDNTITEMQAEVALPSNPLAGETGVSVIQSGQYGLAHATMVHRILIGFKEEGVVDNKCAVFLTCAYFYQREYHARGTTDVASWYLDSRLDFLMAVIAAKEWLTHA